MFRLYLNQSSLSDNFLIRCIRSIIPFILCGTTCSAVAQSASVPNASGIVFIKKTGTGNGSSWENACPNLADVLLQAQTDTAIKQIWVAEGTYYPMHIAGNGSTNQDKAFVLTAGLKVYGGFPADATTSSHGDLSKRNPQLYLPTTILSGDLNNDDIPDSARTKIDNVHHVIIAAGQMINNGDTASLDGFTILGGYSSFSVSGEISVNGITTISRQKGGGIYIADASPILMNDSIVGNQAYTHGGGVCISGIDGFASPLFSRVVISNNNIVSIENEYGYGGGGVYSTGLVSSVFTDVSIKNNTGICGGGMYLEGNYERSIFRDGSISNNTAHLGGGGIYITNSSSPEFTRVSICENTSLSFAGGGYASNGAKPVLTGVIISGNKAITGTGYGGGFFALGNNTVLKITNSLVCGNFAFMAAGGIMLDNGAIGELTNLTITGNRAGERGGDQSAGPGGLHISVDDRKQVVNCIISQNLAPQQTTDDVNMYSTIVFSHCLFGYRPNVWGKGDNPEFINPVTPELAPTVEGNYNLKSVSPAVDQGDNDYYLQMRNISDFTGETDLAGNPRLKNATIDYGAYEFHVDPTLAINDYVVTCPSTPVTVKILDNDMHGTCPRSVVVMDTIANTGLRHGSLKINHNTDTSFTYTPDAGFFGLDSVDYYIKCNADSSAARVYFLVPRALSEHYLACPSTSVKIGFDTIVGLENITCLWYNAETDGDLIKMTTSDTLHIIKDTTPLQTFWAEMWYRNIIFPRYKVSLERNYNCGDSLPTGCALTGTLIFKEDFGGNNAGSPQRAADPEWTSTHKTSYSYVTRTAPTILPDTGEYGLLKNVDNYVVDWAHNPDDHTSPNDRNTGYFLTFNADSSSGQFFEFELNSLCSGSNLTVSAWLMNMTPLAYLNTLQETYLYPNAAFVVEDLSGRTLCSFQTGNINAENNPLWVHYAFNFRVPEGVSSVKVKLVNDQTNAGIHGNDLSVDDLEVRFCAPQVILTQSTPRDTSVCAGTSLTFSGNYTDDSTFAPDLSYHWEYSATGDVSRASDWSKIAGTEGSLVGTSVSSVYTIPSTAANNTGYYRMAVGNTANMSHNCQAASSLIHVEVGASPAFSVTDTVACAIDLKDLVHDTVPNRIITFYRDTLMGFPLWSSKVIIVFDTVFYACATDTLTACKSAVRPIHVRKGSYPPESPTKGKNSVCIDDTIALCNMSSTGGVWTVSHPAVAGIVSQTVNRVVIKGLSKGKVYISYTMGTNCQTKVTSLVKVLSATPPRIIIGRERP